MPKQNNRDVVVAVGECGLDYDRNFSSHEDQQTIFRLQLRLAQKLNMPLFFHERAAHDAFVLQVEHHFESNKNAPKLHGVVHCFTSGQAAHLSRYLEFGFCIGITGWVCNTKGGSQLAEIISSVPRDRIMIETDAPYLIPRNAPKSARRKGLKVNEPRLLPYVASKVAELYGVKVTEVAQWTNQNVQNLFGIQIEGNVDGETEILEQSSEPPEGEKIDA